MSGVQQAVFQNLRSFGNPTPSVEYLVVAGGGGGGGSQHAGGGGAGGYRLLTSQALTATGYSVTVGGGGAGGLGTNLRGASGQNSVFNSITSAGGGGGGSYSQTPLSGGSGGGGVDTSKLESTTYAPPIRLIDAVIPLKEALIMLEDRDELTLKTGNTVLLLKLCAISNDPVIVWSPLKLFELVRANTVLFKPSNKLALLA